MTQNNNNQYYIKINIICLNDGQANNITIIIVSEHVSHGYKCSERVSDKKKNKKSNKQMENNKKKTEPHYIYKNDWKNK